MMDIGPCPQRRDTSRNRVSSPNAANTAAGIFGKAIAEALWIFRKVFLDQFYHQRPAAFVCGESFGATREGNLVKASFGDGELDSVGYFFQREDHKRCRLGGIVIAGFDRAGMPAE